jgi:hypothetical protein
MTTTQTPSRLDWLLDSTVSKRSLLITKDVMVSSSRLW